MSIDEVKKELAKHNIKNFDEFDADHPAIKMAARYLESIGQKSMAEYLFELAFSSLVRIGPVDGFLSAAVNIDGDQYLILSNKYPQYNKLDEYIINLVHEIGGTEKVGKSQDECESLANGVQSWLLEKSGKAEDRKPKESEEVKNDVIDEGAVLDEKEKVDSQEVEERAPLKKASAQQKTLIGALLSEELISEEDVQDAKDKQKGAKKPIQELLVELGFLKEEDLLRVTSEYFQMPVYKMTNDDVDEDVVQELPYEMAMKFGVFPIKKEDEQLLLATSNPQNVVALDQIRSVLGVTLKPVLCSISQINEFIEEFYGADDGVFNLLDNSTEEGGVEDLVGEETAEDLIGDMESVEGEIAEEKDDIADMPPQFQALLKEDSPTVKLVNLILLDATNNRASDVHVEPREKSTEVRYRIDGDLRVIMQVPIKFHVRMVARVKILASLDISKNIEPQDGRVQLKISGRKVDFRVSTIPTFHGEKIVIRVLDAASAKTDIKQLGFTEDQMEVFTAAVKSPQGMVFCTGPTGSGKTSTLYAALNYIKDESTNIITVEDPIEFVNEGINQIQVNPARGVTFASGLRSILRQDPNVILVGEVRDLETAEIAVKASLTGHLVLTTIHTNSTVATITRLADIGLDYFQIASSVICIISQRLVKTICEFCKEEYQPESEYLEEFANFIEEFEIKKFYKGKGCRKCSFTGYFGRTAVYEILKVTERLQNIIALQVSEDKLRMEARKDGLKFMIESGIDKVKAGVTSLEEVKKVLGNIEKSSDDIEEVSVEMIDADEQEKKAVLTAGAAITADADEPIIGADVREKPLILAVDDERDILKILTKHLESEGYDVINATNGEDAVNQTIKEKPDLIVMDVMMPIKNGLEAAQELRKNLETAVIPIIMLTANSDKAAQKEGLKAGADDYLTKPYVREKLMSRIKTILTKKKRRLEAENL